MPCIFDIKPEDRHCQYCTATMCDERQPKPVETFTTNKLNSMTEFEEVLETILEEYARRDTEGDFDTWEETDSFVKEKAEVLLAYANLKKEPVSDDLEEEISRCILDEDMNFDSCARHFANWQKTKDESTTEDLGEYINELSKQFPEVSFAKLSRIAVRVAKWQKEQMAAKAIDGVVTFDYYDSGDKTYGCVAHDSFCLEDFGLKDTDKVKMIIVKDEMS